MKKIGIIGANGLVGRELCKAFESDYEIIKVSRQASEDVISFETFLKNHSSEYLAVIYLAARIPSKNDSWIKKLSLSYQDVRDFIRFLLKYGNNVKVILFSSVSVFGASQIHIDTSSKEKPDSLYGFSKLVMEKVCRLYTGTHIIRPSSIFGQGMKRNTFLPYIIDSHKKNKVINVFGTGERLQNYVSVKIFPELISSILNGDDQRELIYALGNDELSNIELANLVVNTNGEGIVNLVNEDNSPSRTYSRNLKSNTAKCSRLEDLIYFVKSEL